MKFEWDARKNNANRDKHGIDFETAKELWLDENRIEIIAPHPVEERRILIASPWKALDGRVYDAWPDHHQAYFRKAVERKGGHAI